MSTSIEIPLRDTDEVSSARVWRLSHLHQYGEIHNNIFRIFRWLSWIQNSFPMARKSWEFCGKSARKSTPGSMLRYVDDTGHSISFAFYVLCFFRLLTTSKTKRKISSRFWKRPKPKAILDIVTLKRIRCAHTICWPLIMYRKRIVKSQRTKNVSYSRRPHNCTPPPTRSLCTIR